jgi:hypothetical protein
MAALPVRAVGRGRRSAIFGTLPMRREFDDFWNSQQQTSPGFSEPIATRGVPLKVIFGTGNRVSRTCSKNPKLPKPAPDIQHSASSLPCQVSGVRCQVSGSKQLQSSIIHPTPPTPTPRFFPDAFEGVTNMRRGTTAHGHLPPSPSSSVPQPSTLIPQPSTLNPCYHCHRVKR